MRPRCLRIGRPCQRANLRARIHFLPDRDIDLAFMAMERNLTFVNQALGDALVEARREVYS